MNPINLFGMTMKSDVTNKEYADSKFISLTKAMQTKVDIAGDKMTGNLDMNNNRVTNIGDAVDNYDCVTKHYLDSTIKPINRSVHSKVSVDGDSMSGDLDMNWHTVGNVKFPLKSCDAANKLYVQIYAERNEINVEMLCKIGEIISIILYKYDSLIHYRDTFSSSLTYAISMYSKYKNIFETTHAGYNEDISSCTILVDLKVNIIKIIEGLPKDIFQELKEELNKEKLFSAPDRGIRKRFRKFLIKRTEQLDSGGLNERLQFLLHKNLLLIDIGFAYLIDSLLHILLLEFSTIVINS